MDGFILEPNEALAKHILLVKIRDKSFKEVIYDNWSHRGMGYALSEKVIEKFINHHPKYFDEDHRFYQLEEFIKLHPEVGLQKNRKGFVKKFIEGNYC